MAAGNFKWYAPALELLAKGDLDLDLNIQAVLVTASYTPDQAAHDQWGDVSANEVANGNGYATHGQALGAITISRSSLTVTFDAADLTWANSTITAKYLVLVKDANGDNALAASDPLIGYVDLDEGGGSGSSTSGDFTVAMNAAGMLRLIAQ